MSSMSTPIENLPPGVVVKDNLLPLQYYQELESYMTGVSIDWHQGAVNDTLDPAMPPEDRQYFTEYYSQDPRRNWQFAKTIYSTAPVYIADTFPLFGPLLEALDVKSLIRIKLNLKTGSEKVFDYPWHNDQNPIERFGDHCKTTVLHIGSNDGFTIFEQGGARVPTVANRAVIFPNKLKHAGTTCTDQPIRAVVNINYY